MPDKCVLKNTQVESHRLKLNLFLLSIRKKKKIKTLLLPPP